MSSPTAPTVGVIGTGISGISSIKELKAAGFNVTGFEAHGDIGGVWNYKNPFCGGYQQMSSNSAGYFYPFTDFPFPASEPNTPHFIPIEQNYAHIRNYALHFDLYRHIKFNERVKGVAWNETRNQWDIRSQCQSDNDNANVTVSSFDRIVLCSGATGKPRLPFNANTFSDKLPTVLKHKNIELYHSVHAQQIASFEGKNVMVVGHCVSGSDMCENALINNARHVYHVSRGAPRLAISLWQTNRPEGSGAPTVDSDVALRGVPFDPSKYAIYLDDYGFPTPRNPSTNEVDFGAPIAFCKGWPDFVKEGLITPIHGEVNYERLFSNSKSDTNTETETKSVWVGNELYKNIDIIIFATGYDTLNAFSYLLGGDGDCDTDQNDSGNVNGNDNLIAKRFQNKVVNAHKNLLYLLCFIPGFKNDSIAISGGNIFLLPAMYEMQSRMIAEVWRKQTESGLSALPVPCKTEEEQLNWVEKNLIEFNPIHWGSYTTPNPFLDEWAEIMGVLPTREDYTAYGDAYGEIYDRLQFGRLMPAQYRLVGPGKHPKAMEWLVESLAIIEEESPEVREMACRVKERIRREKENRSREKCKSEEKKAL